MRRARRAWCAAALALLFGATLAGAAPPAPGKRGARTPPPHSISRDNLASLCARLVPGGGLGPRKVAAGIDTVRLVALGIDFPDLAMGSSPPGPGLPADEPHDRFYFQNQFRYLAQYFTAASCGRLQLVVDVADSVARAAHPQTYYGAPAGYDSLMIALTRTAVRAADATVNFAAYDGVVVVHAGPGQESDVAGDSPRQIWSGYLDERTFRETLSSKDSVVTGIRTQDGGHEVRSVVILPEWEVQDLTAANRTRLGSLGVYAHEVGQRLGLVPLFDSTPSPVPDSQGIGNFDVMGYGLWVANGFIPPLPSAFSRVLMGWADPVDVVRDADVVLRDHERGAADSIVVRVPISEREYFLVSYIDEDPDGPIVKSCAGQEPDPNPRRFFDFDDQNGDCRFNYVDRDSNGVLSAGDLIDSYAGAEWDFFMTDLIGLDTAGEGYGLLVLHVDELALQEVLARQSTNVEGDPHRKAVDVEEADGIQDLDRIADNSRAFGCAADFLVRGRSFGPNTIPDSRSANGAPTGIRIELEALPDSLAGPIFGARARVRVRFEAPPQAAAPRRRARRDLPGTAGSDLVALDLGTGRSALVVPADSGQVLLASADLDEAPVADADAATLRPWVTVPAAWRGTWAGPPAVGVLGYDSLAATVLSADVDSLGQRRTRVFAWRNDASEVRDLDGDPATRTGLFASLPGSARPPFLFDVDGDGRLDVVAPRQTADGVRIAVFLSRPLGSWLQRDVEGTPGEILTGGPVGVRPGVLNGTIYALSGLAWTEADTTARRTSLRVAVAGGPDPRVWTFLLPTAWTPGTVRLACADLDGDTAHELVGAGSDGAIGIVHAYFTDSGPGRALEVTTRIAAATLSPLALADLDGDGTLEILVASESAMHALSLTGAEMTGWPYEFRLEPGLERETDPGRGAGSPLAADLDGDGRVEVALHLPGGAFLVWDALGKRRRDLEAALPAGAGRTPLLGDLDGDGVLELAACGRFARLHAGYDSLLATPRTEIATWSLPRAGAIAWGELGGDGSHAFHDARRRPLRTYPNDIKLPSFVVGPNPASESVQARIRLTAPARVRCRLFDLEGQAVRDASREGAAGSIVEFSFDLRGLASGVYLAHLELSTGGHSTRPLAVRH